MPDETDFDDVPICSSSPETVELPEEAESDVHDYVFTFGHGQKHFGYYVVIRGTFTLARAEMFRHYGASWCMQYDSREAAQVEKWHLTELK